MTKIEAGILKQLRNKGKSFWELLRDQGTHIPRFIESLKALLEKGIVSFDPQRKEFLIAQTQSPSSTSTPPPPNITACPHCYGKGFILQEPFLTTLHEFQRIIADRPLPTAKYDQGTINPLDLALKAEFMYQRGDLEDRTLLLLGDDDLFGIYLALLKLARHLLVLDIDSHLLEYISNKTVQHGLDIELRVYDVQNDLPSDIRKACQVFVSEPPESLKGMKMFLERGIASLKEQEGVGYFGLTTLESSWPKWLEIQKFLLTKKMVITDILPDFSWYPEQENYWEEFYQRYYLLKKIPHPVGQPNTNWYRSHLLRIETTEELPFVEEDLYMDEETWATPQSFSESSSFQ
jgi:hypothetical protein